jgi:hypothetical protein
MKLKRIFFIDKYGEKPISIYESKYYNKTIFREIRISFCKSKNYINIEENTIIVKSELMPTYDTIIILIPFFIIFYFIFNFIEQSIEIGAFLLTIISYIVIFNNIIEDAFNYTKKEIERNILWENLNENNTQINNIIPEKTLEIKIFDDDISLHREMHSFRAKKYNNKKELEYKEKSDKVKREAIELYSDNELIKYCESINLHPRPEGYVPSNWLADCIRTGKHSIMISTIDNQWGCPYCSKKGGINELREWYESKNKK